MIPSPRSARRVVVVTGAGFSAPSGMPTYRPGGQDSPEIQRIQHLSHAHRYGNHLDELWAHWNDLAAAAVSAEPGPAHLALAGWARDLVAQDGSMTVATQNVDGLHQRAGLPAESLIEVHGNIARAYRVGADRCERELFGYTPVPGGPPPASPAAIDRDGEVSRRTRPDIVLFGEQPRGMRRLMRDLLLADLLVVAGTSGTVFPVAGIREHARSIEHQRGRDLPTVLINDHPWGTFDVELIGDVSRITELRSA